MTYRTSSPSTGRTSQSLLRALVARLKAFRHVPLQQRFAVCIDRPTIGRRAGYIESDEGQMINRAFVLNDRMAAKIMTPLESVVAVNETSTIRQAAGHVFRHAYSHYPLFGKSIDDVKGLVMSRDILEALTEGKDQEPASSICRPCLIVPANMRSDTTVSGNSWSLYRGDS